MASVAAEASYTQKWLNQYYPRQAYQGLRGDQRRFTPHFLTSLKQPDESIIQWIDTCNAKHQAYINAPDTREIHTGSLETGIQKLPAHLFTPLHMAAIMSREAVVDKLCAIPYIDCAWKDLKGWTSLQHAIARNHPGIIARMEAAYGKAAKDQFPFLRSLAHAQVPTENMAVANYRDASGVRSLTQAEFQAMNGGAKFYDGILATPEALFRNWVRQGRKGEPILPWMSRQYAAYQENLPALFLSDEGTAGLGVRAGQALKKGDIATLYGSELIAPEKEKEALESNYSYTDTTGKWVRNWGAIINDGLPNIEVLPLCVDGVQLDAMVCLRDVAEGEQLLSNYGVIHATKWRARTELGMDQILQRYPKPDSLEKEWRRYKRSDRSDRFIGECEKSDLCYLLHTPSTLLSLIIRGHFNLNEVRKLLQNPEVLKMASFDQKFANMQKYYVGALALIEHFKGKATQEQREYVAAKFETSVRAGHIALALTVDDFSKEAFDRIANAADAYYSLLESTALNREEALYRVRTLPEKEELITFAKKNNIPVLAKSRQDFAIASRDIEAKGN
jgi:hypothetical protein